jgi:hypothetical protein
VSHGALTKFARSLFDLAMADEVADPGLKALAWWAWDALDLADARMINETRDDIIQMIQSALDAHTLLGEAPG